MWGWKVRICEMLSLVVRCGDDQGSMMRGVVNWSGVVWNSVYWCIVVGCFFNEMRKSWVS